MVEKFNIFYEPAGEDRIIHLYLPDDYWDSDERYPVLYMFDGHNMFSNEDATYGVCWGLKDFLDHWQKKMIVVGMECSHTGHSRLSEYCPYKIRTRIAGTITGIGKQTMDWIVETVKPYIDSHYRTWAHREATGIGGSSMGGMMALYAILRYNRWFSKAAVVSPALGFAMRQFRKEVADATLAPDTRIFFSWGTREGRGSDKPMTRYVLELEKAAMAKGARTWLYRQMGGHHCEADWAVQVPTWMDFLWTMP